MDPMLNTALRAVRRAVAIISRASLRIERLYIDKKGPKNYVTESDRQSEQVIDEMLQHAYTEHDILAEEGGFIAAQDSPADYQWVIDPLDGTTNFIHGYPHYAISIALLHRQRLAHALIFDPARNELFHASRGEGAFLNDRRLRVSKQLRYPDALLGAHVLGSGGALTGQSPFVDMLTHCAAVRRTGSVVLDLAYVACGRLDGFVGVHLHPWDMAAGALMVLEAGGLVSGFDGEQSWLDSGEILAASPKVFGQMLAYLQ